MKKDNRSNNTGLQNSGKDSPELQPASIIMDMPEVKDIPGQENIQVPQFREMQDITISSASEEGEGILDDLNTENNPIRMDQSTNVTPLEKKILKRSAGHQPTAETEDFNNMALDETDNDGEALNENGIKQDRSGEDLDVPGEELDDEDENIGEEDEENNTYSQPD